MQILKRTISVIALLSCLSFVAGATEEADETPRYDYSDSAVDGIPERLIILSGDKHNVRDKVMTVLYDTSDLNFRDPSVPRFLFIDREGNTALGIGGFVEGVFMYDFQGAVDDNMFVTSRIPVPAAPTLRSRMAFDMSRSTVFLRLVRNTSLGVLNAYIQTEFSGDDGGYGLKLAMGYVSLGNVTAGLARSTFVDAAADAPGIDYHGPSGAINGERVLLRYQRRFNKNWSAAVSAEMPKLTATIDDGKSELINQRVPDIPLYVQYSWAGEKSHVRASVLFRDLVYRDVLSGRNCYAQGYGLQLSGLTDIYDIAYVFYQVAYGKGIGSFINDLTGAGYDLIPTADGSALKTPETLSIETGFKVNMTKNLFLSGTYSLNRLYGQEAMGPDAYRRGNYIGVSTFYSPISDLMFGVEYLHGIRTNMDHASGTANRVQAMIKYSF